MADSNLRNLFWILWWKSLNLIKHEMYYPIVKNTVEITTKIILFKYLILNLYLCG